MSSGNAYNEETPQNLALKFVEELVDEVLGSNKIIEMFWTMAIICLKIDNLGLEVQPLKTKLTTNGRGNARIDVIDEVRATTIWGI